MEFPGRSPKKKAGSDEALTPSLVRDRYEAATKAVRGEMQDYWLNHSFVLGHQWLWYNPQTRRLDELPRDPDRVQVTINRIWPNSRTIVSKAMQREFTFEVPPTSADDAALRGSKMAESVVESIHYEHDWENKRERFYWTMWKGGTAGICIDWDPDAGGVVAPDDGSGEEITGGDTVETILSIAEMAVEPGVRDAEKARWWVKAEVLPPATVQGAYGLRKAPPADASAGLTPFQQKMMSSHKSGGGASDEKGELTLVLTYYERPNPLRPKGAVAVMVNNEFVQGPMDWPFPFKDHLNLAVGVETPIETRWTGETVLTMARPVQVAYNASWSSIIEHMKQAGNARLMVPQSSIDLIEHLTDLPGEIVPYPDGMDKPDWSSPPQMPAWWIDEPRQLREEMDDIMGVHDISRGSAPANIESGYGLSVLAEQDSTPVGKMVKSAAIVFGKIASWALELYAAEVKDTREAIVRTPSQPPETARWTGKDLVGQTRAEVPLEAVMPRNKVAMVAMAEKMLQMGLIGSFEEFATVAELPGHRSLVDRLSPDVAKARRENHAMALGRPAVPEAFDNHEQHMKELNDFRKSPRYEMLDDEGKSLFEDHAQAHEVLAAEEMGRQRAKAAVDPMMAAVPSKDGSVTLGAGDMPPDGLPAGAADLPGLSPMEAGMPIDEEAAEAGPGAPTAGTVTPEMDGM